MSLISMAILSIFAYLTSKELIQQVSVRQLDALAESKKRDMEKVYRGWEDKLRLIRGMNQLQSGIKEYLESGDEEALARITLIISTITRIIEKVDQISVFDLQGNEIASSGNVKSDHVHEFPRQGIAYAGCFPGESGGIRVALKTAVSMDGEKVGGLELIVDGDDLFQITGNYTGLGETGEAMMVKLGDDDTVMVLNSLRHDPEGMLREFKLDDASADIQEIFNIGPAKAIGGVSDYRGETVWSATRYLPELEWGLIVKVDAVEEEAKTDVLRDALIDTALSLSAFTVIAGILLGIYLTRPIHRLVAVVEKLRDGDMDARADTSGDDEIAYLAESLNEMMDHLESGNNKS